MSMTLRVSSNIAERENDLITAQGLFLLKYSFCLQIVIIPTLNVYKIKSWEWGRGYKVLNPTQNNYRV